MNSIIILLNRAAIFINALFSSLFGKFQNNKSFNHNDTVIIVFQQVFGDAVVACNAINEYAEYYKKENKKVVALVLPQVLNFIKDVMLVSDDITFIPMDFKKFVSDYSYFLKTKKTYRKYSPVILTLCSTLSADLFSCICLSSKKIALTRGFLLVWPPANVILNRLAYTAVLRAPKDGMMLRNHGLLLNYIGCKNYKAKLPVLRKQERIVNYSPYCVICPGASVPEKCWPLERYVQIIDFVIERYGLEIYLCGGKGEEKYEKAIIKLSDHKDHIHSRIAKSTFKEWSSIVQYADLVIGNDSATVHLAAAGRRKTICILGVYDKNLFFPYQVDEPEESDRLPITIVKDMPCEWCRTKGYYSGYGNNKCKKAIREGKCALCIDKITVTDVETEIVKLMES